MFAPISYFSLHRSEWFGGDKEYTLQDAIELAGMQLEDFFSEEETAYDNQIDRIKNLAFYQ